MNRPLRSHGFTLIEVMISITLLAMLLVATLAAMRTFGNTQSTLEKVTGRVDEIRSVSDFLRGRITAAMPVPRVGSVVNGFEAGGVNDNYGIYFFGNSKQLIWVAPFVAGANLGGVFVMRLEHTNDNLELRWAPYQREVEDINWSGVKPRVLLREVDSFELGYLPMYDADWEEQWLGGQSSPVAVRMTIKANERFWPELVMHVGGSPLNLR